ncbi:hypothetical protein C8J57DRAFT_1515738 [Mycena rebaudengoi]|nr:hypothetical protein C8J57DRAFT_1515738 [Mycena rebaudengoi]
MAPPIPLRPTLIGVLAGFGFFVYTYRSYSPFPLSVPLPIPGQKWLHSSLDHTQRQRDTSLPGGGFSAPLFIVLVRTAFDVRYNERPSMRADALSLVLLPVIMVQIHTPSSSCLALVALDSVVTPVIGSAIFAAIVRA